MKIFDAIRSLWHERLQKKTKRILAQKWFDVGLQGKMSALVTIGLMGLIAIFGYLTVTTTRQTTQQLLNEHVYQARILADTMDSSVSNIAGMLTVLSTQIDMDDPKISLEEWSAILLQDFTPVKGLYVYNNSRQLLASSMGAPEIVLQDTLFSQISTGSEKRIISTQSLTKPLALVAVPINSPDIDQPVGFFVAVLDLSDPQMFMPGGTFDLAHGKALLVLDFQGRVLVSSHPDRTLTASTIEKITEHIALSDQPDIEACLGCEMNSADSGTIIAYATLSQVPWVVLIWHDSQELFAPVRTIGLQTLVLGLLAILGALLLVFLTTRSVIQPVQMLTEATRKIGGAQNEASMFDSLECLVPATLVKEANHRRDEIGILANSFINMCTRLTQSIEEIKAWNQELDSRVQARTQQLSILNTVALTVNRSLKLEEILERALDEVIQLTNIDVIAIYIQNQGRGELELCAFRGLTEEAAENTFQVGLLDGDCGGVMTLGRTVVVPDISVYRGKGARALQREKIASLMHVPLMTKGTALGSMCVGTHNTNPFNREEQELLTAIANQIAIAVDNARLYADVQRKERIRGELINRTLAAQEEERKRIARELHDEISQSLTALLYDAEDGLELDELPQVKKRLQTICTLSKQTLDEVHKLILDLRPSMLDQLGLIPALRWLMQNRLESKGVRVRVNTNAELDPINKQISRNSLSPEIETTLYRVMQEAINNISRHAAARNVTIEFFLIDGTASISIQDDGIGFDLAELNMDNTKEISSSDVLSLTSRRGLGLLGMQERIELMGGEMEVISAPGSGTRIDIRVPITTRSPVYG